MSRREVIASALVVGLVGFAVRVWAAALIDFPRPEDTAYYVSVARNLVEGRGLVSEAIWSYGTPPLVFPRPAFEVWLPFPTFLAAIPMALLGTSFAAAQWSSVLVGSLVAVLAWRLAADVAAERSMPAGRARTLALGTGLASGVYLPLVLHSALPDSTMPFAALSLAAVLLMSRIARDPRGAQLTDPRLVALGLLLGFAALTRNEAAWLALAWLVLAWRVPLRVAGRVRLIGTVAALSFLVFLPWAIRDWQAFGSPFPGQALTNALSLEGRDIFAWSDRPTIARYLAAGPAALLGLRATGLEHNVMSVLLLPGMPVAAIGLLALPWTGRGAVLRPLVLVGGITFIVTTLVFPVSTTWGTFLHAAGAIQVLVVLSALLGLDAVIVAVGRRRGWTRPVSWLGPALGISGSILMTAIFIPGFGTDGQATALTYRTVAAALEAAGEPLGPEHGPVITDFPIWFAEATGTRALALPDEPPTSVLDLARGFPGTTLLVLRADNGGSWPEVLGGGDPDAGADPAAACFTPIALAPPPGASAQAAALLAEIRVFRIACP